MSKQKLLRSFTIQPSVPFTYATTSTIFKFPLRVSLGSARGIFQACRILLKTKSARPAARRATISHGVRDPSMTNEKKDKPTKEKTNSAVTQPSRPSGTIRRRLPSHPHTSRTHHSPLPVWRVTVQSVSHDAQGTATEESILTSPCPESAVAPCIVAELPAVADGDLATPDHVR